MSDDFSTCLVTNARMAARAVTRRYDAALRPYGITAAQFSLLGKVGGQEALTVSALADANAMDRTSLTRNLDLLERMGLIASLTAPKGNGRLCALTPKGRALITELVPIWRQGQAEMRALLSPQDFDATIKVLKRLAEV
jgi:DNA-binding MarR family transcriptional regulator